MFVVLANHHPEIENQLVNEKALSALNISLEVTPGVHDLCASPESVYNPMEPHSSYDRQDTELAKHEILNANLASPGFHEAENSRPVAVGLRSDTNAEQLQSPSTNQMQLSTTQRSSLFEGGPQACPDVIQKQMIVIVDKLLPLVRSSEQQQLKSGPKVSAGTHSHSDAVDQPCNPDIKVQTIEDPSAHTQHESKKWPLNKPEACDKSNYFSNKNINSDVTVSLGVSSAENDSIQSEDEHLSPENNAESVQGSQATFFDSG